MNFNERLNSYIADIGCSAKELAEASGVSTAAISRYRKGERVPDPDGKQLRMLATGIAQLSKGSLEAQHVLNVLATSISGIAVDYDTFLSNLNALLSLLPASNNELARALSFDPSYISRILAGQRRPADTQAFITGVSQFVARKCGQGPTPEGVASLVGSDWGAIGDERLRSRAIAAWLSTNYTPMRNPIGSFLEKLDSFDLDDYVRAVHFDEMKAPTAPIQLPTTKVYTGLREMMECEIDYLKATAMSRSSADVIMFSDMPMGDMAADSEFPKKWMFGMALLLKKGLHLNIVHNTGRPLPEMMIGLESWIPMYMTGQISPYYLEHMHNDVFCHLLKVSGTVAMQGEAIAGHQGEGRYILTKNRDEVRYYRRRAERMLEKAHPLMRVITSANAGDLHDFEEPELVADGRRRIVMSTLPIGSIPPELLESMLARNKVPESDRARIREFAEAKATQFAAMQTNGDVRLEVPDLSVEEFAEHPPTLELAGMFYEGRIPYTPEEYAVHLEALRKVVEGLPHCTLTIDARTPFRNIQIIVCEKRHVLVSKNASPTIHFVIEHPEMIAAFERFIAPISD